MAYLPDEMNDNRKLQTFRHSV
jgi:hypothetical protein